MSDVLRALNAYGHYVHLRMRRRPDGRVRPHLCDLSMNYSRSHLVILSIMSPRRDKQSLN